MIKTLLENIKKDNIKTFSDNFKKSVVNNSHKTLLLETAAIYNNIDVFNFLYTRTSLDDAALLRLSLFNLKDMKDFNSEYFPEVPADLLMANFKPEHVKHICRLGSKSSLYFMEKNPLMIHLHFNWFVHYGLHFKNEEFLENIFNSQLNKEQTLISCIATIFHKEQTFLPIILENSYEKGLDINFQSNREQIHLLISRYFKNTKKEENLTVNLSNMLVEESIKAVEAVLLDATKDFSFAKTKKSPKF